MAATCFVTIVTAAGCTSQTLTDEERAERQQLIETDTDHPETSNRERRQRTRGR